MATMRAVLCTCGRGWVYAHAYSVTMVRVGTINEIATMANLVGLGALKFPVSCRL